MVSVTNSASEVTIKNLNINSDGSINVNDIEINTINNVKVVGYQYGLTNTLTTWATVPAGKIWYILGIQHSAGASNAPINHRIFANGVIISALAYYYSGTGNGGAQSSYIDLSKFPYKLTAGQTLQRQASDANCVSSCTVFYIEKDA